MGADITKEYASKIINMSLIIQTTLGMSFKDSPCGAKVMDCKIASQIFNKKFVTRWLLLP
tara:strand:+ start:626 stop:805 length:180 start_codon:yes stop_codon:yes gene_type:complete